MDEKVDKVPSDSDCDTSNLVNRMWTGSVPSYWNILYIYYDPSSDLAVGPKSTCVGSKTSSAMPDELNIGDVT